MKPIWVINLVPARAGGEERLDQEWRHLGAITKHLRYAAVTFIVIQETLHLHVCFLMIRLRNPGYEFGEICVYKLILFHLRRPM